MVQPVEVRKDFSEEVSPELTVKDKGQETDIQTKSEREGQGSLVRDAEKRGTDHH